MGRRVLRHESAYSVDYVRVGASTGAQSPNKVRVFHCGTTERRWSHVVRDKESLDLLEEVVS
jgi:hypothetical protein